MSGAVCGFLALANIVENDPKDAMWWLILALIIDGVDGTFARMFRVTEHLPNVDGVTIDNIVDFFTYVVVPAFYVWWIPVVPDGWGIPAAIAILMSSQYHFSDLRHKTHDNYFRGFPALWNLVIFGFFVFQPGPWLALGLIGFFAVSTFVPLKFVHPFRVEKLRKTNLALATVGSLALIWAIWTFPDPSMAAKVVLIGVAVWYLVLGVSRTWDDRPSKT
jgi:phosphatidylcholine synthase